MLKSNKTTPDGKTQTASKVQSPSPVDPALPESDQKPHTTNYNDGQEGK